MAAQVIPTDRPTLTPTFTPSPTPERSDASPTPRPTDTPAFGLPSPTPLLGQRMEMASVPTATRVPNPNAPRIEFFTADVLQTSPGTIITLYWSTRGVTSTTIYRVNADGERTQLWNVDPDGSLPVQTRLSDRGQLTFVLSISAGGELVEQALIIPLTCPDAWFFDAGLDTCPDALPQETLLIEQDFERGRMIYVRSNNQVYVLFNDGFAPAWINFENRFDPAVHAESEPSFIPPPGFEQPVRILGFVWRGNDTVRNRLGLGLEPEAAYDGFTQSESTGGQRRTLYISASDGAVLQLLPGGEAWQIITPPTA